MRSTSWCSAPALAFPLLRVRVAKIHASDDDRRRDADTRAGGGKLEAEKRNSPAVYWLAVMNPAAVVPSGAAESGQD